MNPIENNFCDNNTMLDCAGCPDPNMSRLNKATSYNECRGQLPKDLDVSRVQCNPTPKQPRIPTCDSGSAIVLAAHDGYFKTQVWEAKLRRNGQRHFLRTLDMEGAINIWIEEASTMDIMVNGKTSGIIAGLLHDMKIPFSIAMADVTDKMKKESLPETPKQCKLSGVAMNWTEYHRLDTVYEFLDHLAEEFPYLCCTMSIGKSVEGRDMKVLRISNGCRNNECVWIDGCIHAREWITVSVVTYLADQIVRNFDKQPDSVTNKDWYILPVMNPDGYEYTHTHDRMWRKNRAHYGECVGVDLNRNFSYGWGVKEEEGSSEDPGSIFYRGPTPFSEPEAKAVKQLFSCTDCKFKVFLSFHSYGEVIIFPWGFTADPCPDYVKMLQGGSVMAKAIFEKYGHTFKVGSTKDLMYFASGTNTDWSYGQIGIPYSYMVELRGKKHRFLLPKEEILSSSMEVYCGVLSLLEFVDRVTEVEKGEVNSVDMFCGACGKSLV